ncbi:MAG: Flp family type IVb pilin [Deltaproteobacteria bacterium]|nr:Flp family type IVb pilin [Deltaproteobacteria bacterium]
MEKLIKFFKDEQGVTAIEYALIASLIAVFIVAALYFVGGEVSETYDNVASSLVDAGSGS